VFQPHLRLAGGASVVKAELRTSGDGTFSDSGVTPLGSMGLGFTLRTPTRMFETKRGQLSSLSLGLMLEAGYTLAEPIALALERDGSSDRGIPITESALGELSSSGFYLRASLVTRF
jgi:hypothetical protein